MDTNVKQYSQPGE